MQEDQGRQVRVTVDQDMFQGTVARIDYGHSKSFSVIYGSRRGISENAADGTPRQHAGARRKAKGEGEG
ncbi:hypothetical protein Sgleb_49030 [Streptomyces glebosus]|uniref:Uncharacterized protein n=1 Tax=Streptomyces glebosus TaxID=249580 RepID=A0A640T3K9_9ACTN|nr:hypothetical protein Sgleb_49030 [Streptomyces glebosus]GHG86427.1 hypothetical protein GCM10010513_67700 [Streptomyces glebosus]